MSALGPIAAFPLATAGSVAREVVVGGSVSWAGTLATIKIKVLYTVAGALGLSGQGGATRYGRTASGAIHATALVLTRWLRIPLRFAKRKGIVTRGVDR